MQVLTTELKIFKNKDFLSLKNFLSKHTKRAYLVGGATRDIFLKKECSDIDIEVYDIAPEKFDALMQELGASGVGKSFFVYKYKNYDISLPRTENKVSIGHRGFEVSLCQDEKEASSRRDFTINSIMINIFNKEILDFFGGISDLMCKILRIVDEKSFTQDSLRVLRAVQFAARFDLVVEPRSLELMREIDLGDLSASRINVELVKLFRAEFQEVGLRLIYDLGIFKFLFLAKMDDEQCMKICGILNEGKKFVKNELFFLYIIINFLHLDGEKLLKRLNLSNAYQRVIKEPFFIDVSDAELLEIAIKTPISQWLGAYKLKIIQRAKKFGVYEEKFNCDVKSSYVVKAGFKGKDIGDEISRLQKQKIKEFLDNFYKN